MENSPQVKWTSTRKFPSFLLWGIGMCAVVSGVVAATFQLISTIFPHAHDHKSPGNLQASCVIPPNSVDMAVMATADAFRPVGGSLMTTRHLRWESHSVYRPDQDHKNPGRDLAEEKCRSIPLFRPPQSELSDAGRRQWVSISSPRPCWSGNAL